ncbi:MAG: ABC transporter substrate-binding protein [Trebonia sp.]
MTGRWLRATCASAAVAMLAAGCSSAGGGTSSTSAMDAASYGPPEKTTLNVGVVPAMDSAGFFVAMNQGLFAREGLTIHYTPETSSDTAITTQVNGGLDISAGNYVSYIQAEMKHPDDGLEIVSEGSLMTAGAQVVYTTPHSGIHSLSDLEGKTLTVNAPDNIDYLLATSVLQENGIHADSVHFPNSPVAFPSIPGSLAKGTVQAAVLPEPFASIAMQQSGAVPITDLNQGATQQFPIEGYVVTKKWATQNPNTLSRFLAALSEGQELSDTHRAAVEKAFENIKGGPSYGQVPAEIADVMALNDYPIGVDRTRLQRVSNVMFQLGLEPGRKTPYTIGSMLLPRGAFNFTPYESGIVSSSD